VDLGTAEADGAAAAAASSFTLSPEAITSEYEPWSTGANVALAELGGGLALDGEADGAAAGAEGATTAGLGAMQATAPASSAGTGQLGGSLQLAGEADTEASAIAPLSGAGNPSPIQAKAGGISNPGARISAAADLPAAASTGAGATAAAASLAISAALAGRGDGATSAQPAALNLSTAIAATIAGSSATSASLRVQSVFAGVSPGQASGTATTGALAQLRGLAGNEGWESPQMAALAACKSTAAATLTITGAPSVTLAGTA
jgi:hypothetical protein